MEKHEPEAKTLVIDGPAAPNQMNRMMRRIQGAAERRERESGNWSPWMKADVPGVAGAMGDGWLREVRSIVKNPWCVVLIRPVATPWGMAQHAAIRTASETELSWREKQRLKSTIFGPGFMAVEIMPPDADIVNGANMWHLWILPEGVGLPFGI